MKNILQKIGAFFKAIFFFLSSKIFLKNISLMVILVVGFFALAYFSLSKITFHGKFTETPEVVGLNLKEIKKKYTNFNFHVDSAIYNKNIEPLTIITQDPYSGEKIKGNRTIYLTVSPIQPPYITVPDIYGDRLDLAIKALKNSRFVPKIHRFENDRADSTILKVIYFNPTTGDSTILATGKNKTKLFQGSTVHLVVARGLGEQVLLPNLVCNTYDVAQFLIEGSDLKIGNISTNGIVTDSMNAYIVKQNPSFVTNRMIKKGREVDIWLSNKPPAHCNIDVSDTDLDVSSHKTTSIDNKPQDKLPPNTDNTDKIPIEDQDNFPLRVRSGNNK
jgi:beta-lactam-binding protein with PASTA domain